MSFKKKIAADVDNYVLISVKNLTLITFFEIDPKNILYGKLKSRVPLWRKR